MRLNLTLEDAEDWEVWGLVFVDDVEKLDCEVEILECNEVGFVEFERVDGCGLIWEVLIVLEDWDVDVGWEVLDGEVGMLDVDIWVGIDCVYRVFVKINIVL